MTKRSKQMIETFLLVICSLTGAVASLNHSTLESNGEISKRADLHPETSNTSNIFVSKGISYSNQSHSASVTQKSVEEIHSRNGTSSEPYHTVTVGYENATENIHFLKKIHRTLTRSKDAIWATITLTFMCVLLVISVAQSQMWKDYRGPESQGVPLPNFNERVLFRDVMEHKMNSLKQIFQKRKKKKKVSELESLLASGDWDDESTSIPIDSS